VALIAKTVQSIQIDGEGCTSLENGNSVINLRLMFFWRLRLNPAHQPIGNLGFVIIWFVINPTID
jgi:hypothetical protein